ncbi:hypothetical protein GDO81_000587 [Engystomops pustulosus]|uniref:Uncharacterized protein n=1 Tax=Engystomops pustulosus TaxID=76066 RepID=A0AAV7D5G9_ENGPU|nr:hypothetical protein GDO81_000587 [Engystomops pustulosus]
MTTAASFNCSPIIDSGRPLILIFFLLPRFSKSSSCNARSFMVSECICTRATVSACSLPRSVHWRWR